MSERISGINFTVNIGDFAVRVNKASLEITDNSATIKDGGIPAGFVRGECSAEGTIELDALNLRVLMESASAAGSFQDLGVFDMLFFAKTTGEEMRVQAFGCLLKISNLLDFESAGGDKHVTTLPFEVTSPDFIRINGTPYGAAAIRENIQQ